MKKFIYKSFYFRNELQKITIELMLLLFGAATTCFIALELNIEPSAIFSIGFNICSVMIAFCGLFIIFLQILRLTMVDIRDCRNHFISSQRKEQENK